MHRQQRVKMSDQSPERSKTDVGWILSVGKPEGWSVRDENVELPPMAHSTQAKSDLERKRAPTHLALCVLVWTWLVTKASTKSGESISTHFRHFAVDVGAPLRTGNWDFLSKWHPRHIRKLHAWVVVARNVKQRDVEPADEIFEIVERQVAARDDDVWSHRRQAVAIKRFVHLIGDGQYAQRCRLDALEPKRGPGLIDRHERHSAVASHGRQLTEDVSPHPPRGRRQIGGFSRRPSLWIRDPQ